ncbi:methionyl-tRNA formyltransferase [Microbacterium sp. ASV49]|uniref:Methionyl-tRNA formyltransferase n=1 Tax=Microbacterium candidum TaxID=3041922 RepID=A0ABT7MZA8_9MICO|nr:methionyl-tRNA formyltransferase [Microbacterium sp. ASV49]MDL9979791.1 methionyl-tRNA formyltransferase [Microbacterium sp. ASV49]
MRVVFAGTPDPAVPSLRLLAATEHEIVGVVSRNDAPLGRKRVMTPSPTAGAADELGLPVIKTDRLDAAATEQIAALEPDLGVIVAYGGLVREPLLSAPRLGWINLHFSLLPLWRGAAPVQHALIAGDAVVGAAVFQLVPELDAGDVFDAIEYRPEPDATSGDVLDALAHRGAYLLRSVVDGLAAGTAIARPQEGTPTFAPKLSLDDGWIRWGESAHAVLNRVRGVTPEPGAHSDLDGTRLKVLAARAADSGDELPPGQVELRGRAVLVGTADEPIALVTVQPAGRGAMAAADWWRGLRTVGPVVLR